MNRKIVLSALMSIVLVSVIVIASSLQTPTEALTTMTTEESSPTTFEERLLSLAEKLPESAKSHLTKIASIASKRADLGLREVEPESPEESPVIVGRLEFAWFIVDKNFAPVKPQWEVYDGTYYVADSLYYIFYYIDVAADLDLEEVALTDTWKRGMVWGTEEDVTKSYYLLGWDTNIPGAGPGNYNPATGVLSITFDPEAHTEKYEYGIEFMFLAKTGFVNQFISKPRVSHTLSPKTTPPLIAGTFYDMWLKMKGFKVRGLPLQVAVEMEVPDWQSTENGVYIKNMDPQIAFRAWWGADPPDVPGPTSGGGGWLYFNSGFFGMPSIDPPFLDHWIQVAFQKSTVTPAPNWGNFLYDGGVWMVYANKGFGIVTGDTPQLTLSSADWDVWVTTGLEGDVISLLDYYFEEPKSTIITD